VNRYLPAFLVTLLTLCGGAPQRLLAQAPPAVTDASSSARQLVEVNTQRIFDTLNTRRAEFARDQSVLRAFVATEIDALFDRNYSARMVLGRHARGASEADIALFADALIQGLLQRYGALLLEFNTQLSTRITSEAALPRGVGVRVSSELIRRGEPPVALDYLLRQNAGQWKIFDVIIEGVSMVQTFRQQFDAQLQRKSIREVAEELRAGQLQVAAD